MRISLTVFVLAICLSACTGGSNSTPSQPSNSGPTTYTKTLTIIGIPSEKTYKIITESVPASGKNYDDSFFASAGVSPAPQYAVCTDAPINGFIGEIVGARRNGVLNCRFTSSGPGIIYISENSELVKCGMEQNGMGRPIMDGSPVGGGLHISIGKIQADEDLGSYAGLPVRGANPAQSDQYPTYWIAKLNQLLLVQGISIVRFDFSAGITSTVRTGFYTYDGTDGLHIQGRWFGANANNLRVYPDSAINTTGLSEGAEMISSGRNNPACPPSDPLNFGIVDWGKGEYSEVGKNIIPWGVLYGLAEKVSK